MKKVTEVVSAGCIEQLAKQAGKNASEAAKLANVYERALNSETAQKAAANVTANAGNLKQRSIALIDSYNRDELNWDPDGFHFHGDSIRACQSIHDLIEHASLKQLQAAASKVRKQASAREALDLREASDMPEHDGPPGPGFEPDRP